MGDELHFFLTENGELIVGVTFGLLALYSLLRGAHAALVPYLQARAHRRNRERLPRTEDN